MRLKHLILSALLALAPVGAFAQGAGPSLVTEPPAGSSVSLNSLSPLNIGITVENFAAWIGSGGSMGNTVIGTGVNKVSIAGAATTVAPVITVGGTSSDTNIGLVVAGKGTGALILGGSTLANGSAIIPTVASAVNQVELRGAIATTGIAGITVAGASADTNAAISFSGKGTGAALIGGTTTTLAGLQVAQPASRVNGLLVTPGATGTAVALSAGTAGADANTDLQLTSNGTGQVNIGNTTTCTGTTTATCSAQRFIVSITGLTTAAGAESDAMVVTNTKVAATDVVQCNVNIYAGTGVPLVARITPGTNSVSMTILNAGASDPLNATVPVACVVL